MEQYRVEPGSRVQLGEWDAGDTSALRGGKAAAKAEMERLGKALQKYQEMLYAQHQHRLLIVLQGMDTSGKDGIIRHVFDAANPQGLRIANFKVPTPVELDHDYLWRVHAQTPAKGEIVIFNRSHYEDVLVVRVHALVPEAVWSKRYDHINQFEKMMAEEGTTILKFFLHIDADEQKKRLQARLDDPEKRWKFNPKDLDERKLWGEYQRAYEDVLSKTSTDWAPWYIVPSNQKWYRNLVVASVLVEKMAQLGLSYPQPAFEWEKIRIE